MGVRPQLIREVVRPIRSGKAEGHMKIIVIRSLVAVALLLTLGAAPTRTADEGTYVLLVTSATPDHEVRFQGAYLHGQPDAPLQMVGGTTPYESWLETDVVAGICRGATGEIRVELRKAEDGEMRELLSAAGSRLVIGENIMAQTPRFVTAF